MLETLRLQEEAGVDLVTDGEQRRDNFYSFVAEKLDGVSLLTLAEMLDLVEDRQAFERILQTLDVPAYAISNAVCVGTIARARPLAVDDLLFLKRHTDKPVKVTLPGPYLLTRAHVYPSRHRRRLPDEGGPGRRRRAGAARGVGSAGRGGRRLHPVRRAGADRAGLHPGADAHLHVRGAGGAQRPGRGAGVRGAPDQPGARRGDGGADRAPRVPRQLEPERVDPAERELPAARAPCSSACTSSSSSWSTPRRAPAIC